MDGEALAALETFVATEPSPDAALEKEERGRFVREALLQIAEPYRAVIVLRHYENLKFREIAAVLDVSTDTISRDWKFARKWLLRELRDGSSTTSGTSSS